MNKVSTLKDSDVAARGVASTVGGAVAGGAASAVVGNLLSRERSHDASFTWAQILTQRFFAEIESLFRREAQLEGLQSRALSVKPSSTSGSGIGGAVAGGAASAVVGNLLNQIESLFRRDEYVIFAISSNNFGAKIYTVSVTKLLSETLQASLRMLRRFRHRISRLSRRRS